MGSSTKEFQPAALVASLLKAEVQRKIEQIAFTEEATIIDRSQPRAAGMVSVNDGVTTGGRPTGTSEGGIKDHDQ